MAHGKQPRMKASLKPVVFSGAKSYPSDDACSANRFH